MKKSFFYAGILAAGLMTVSTSCSKDDTIIDNGGIETPVADGQSLVLMASNGGDGLTTKAGRPMYSSEAKQNIDKVHVKIVSVLASQPVEEVYSFTVDNWMDVSNDYDVNGHGKQYVHKLGKDNQLPDGEYKVYAIGYTREENSDFGTAIGSWLASDQSMFHFFKGVIDNLPGKTVYGEEMFAGEIASISVVGGEFDLTKNPTANVLTLHRQVAGNMGYYTDIPTFKRGASALLDAVNPEKEESYKPENEAKYKELVNSYELRLVSSNASNKILCSAFNTGFTTTGKNVRFIVNGKNDGTLKPNASFATYKANSVADIEFNKDKDAYAIYTIALKDWFPNGDVNKDGILGEGDANEGIDNWKTPSHMVGAGFKPGSVFAGEFMIPFLKVSGKNTLQLQLVASKYSIEDKLITIDHSQKEVLRVWDINLPADDPQLGTPGDKFHVQYVDETTGELHDPNNLDEENNKSYSMVRNHMYAVGEKGSDKYDPEVDKPEPLDKGQTLELKVNDNWELIHQMEVE